MVGTSEREMVRKTRDETNQEKFTSLQATYEDTIPPHAADDWEHED